jgi:hypothetical protein
MAGLFWALAFLVLGLLEVALVQRFVYPALRRRHELAKLTASHGTDPSRYMLLIRVQSLVLLPILGFVLSDRLRTLFG